MLVSLGIAIIGFIVLPHITPISSEARYATALLILVLGAGVDGFLARQNRWPFHRSKRKPDPIKSSLLLWVNEYAARNPKEFELSILEPFLTPSKGSPPVREAYDGATHEQLTGPLEHFNKLVPYYHKGRSLTEAWVDLFLSKYDRLMSRDELMRTIKISMNKDSEISKSIRDIAKEYSPVILEHKISNDTSKEESAKNSNLFKLSEIREEYKRLLQKKRNGGRLNAEDKKRFEELKRIYG